MHPWSPLARWTGDGLNGKITEKQYLQLLDYLDECNLREILPDEDEVIPAIARIVKGRIGPIGVKEIILGNVEHVEGSENWLGQYPPGYPGRLVRDRGVY